MDIQKLCVRYLSCNFSYQHDEKIHLKNVGPSSYCWLSKRKLWHVKRNEGSNKLKAYRTNLKKYRMDKSLPCLSSAICRCSLPYIWGIFLCLNRWMKCLFCWSVHETVNCSFFLSFPCLSNKIWLCALCTFILVLIFLSRCDDLLKAHLSTRILLGLVNSDLCLVVSLCCRVV